MRGRPSRWRSRWVGLAVSLVVAFVSLTLVEVCLWKNGVKLPPDSVQCGAPQYEANSAYGYCLRPNISTTYQYPQTNPRTLRLVSNSDGFRNAREFGDADPRTRLLVMGDSFVFGQGVEAEERFTEMLEAMRPVWRVDNLGMTGYGPDLMLMAYQALGRKCKSDAMILCIYTDDFRRVQPRYAGPGFKIPRFQLADGHLQRVAYPARKFWDRFYITAAIRSAWFRIRASERRLNAAILEETLARAREDHVIPAIVFLPGRVDLPEDEARRRWLGQFARDHETPFIDVTAPIHAGGADAFLGENWHLSPLGHKIVADELERFISAEVLVGKNTRTPIAATTP